MRFITSITLNSYKILDFNSTSTSTSTRITEIRQSDEDIQTQSSSSSPQIIYVSKKSLPFKNQHLKEAKAQNPKTTTESSSSDTSAQAEEGPLHPRYLIMHSLANYESVVFHHPGQRFRGNFPPS